MLEETGWLYFGSTIYVASVIVIGFFIATEMRQNPSSIDSPFSRVFQLFLFSFFWPAVLVVLTLCLCLELLLSPIRRFGRYLGGNWGSL